MSPHPAATERLTLSRERLRQAMLAAMRPPSQTKGEGVNPSRLSWRATLMQTPATRLLLELGQTWWARQPLRLVLPLLAQAAEALLAPAAQRHPIGLVLGAATVGATLALVRPWRWLSATALVTRFLPPLLSELAKHAPVPALPLPPALPAETTRRPAY